MRKPIIALVAVLTCVGCGRNLQRDVYNQLTNSFRVPEAQVARDQFYAQIRERCSLPEDAIFISYDYRTSPFVLEDKELYITVGITLKSLARSPSKTVAYLIHEDVRAVFHRPHPKRVTDKGAVSSMRRFLTEAQVMS